MTDEQLSALLRLKRYEKPDPRYFDRLLEDLHRRQRAELLRRPLWQIAWERLQTFFGEHSMGHVSYAGSLLVALMVGMAGITLLAPTGEIEVAENGGQPRIAAVSSPDRLLSLQARNQLPMLSAPALPAAAQSGLEPVVYQPRYVIDARPVSYEPSSSFNF